MPLQSSYAAVTGLTLRRSTPSRPGGSEGDVGGSASSSRMGVQRDPPSRCLPECTEGCPPPAFAPPPPCRCTLGVRASLRGVHCMACGEPPSEHMDVAADTAGNAGSDRLPPSRCWLVPGPPSSFMCRKSQAISCETGKAREAVMWLYQIEQVYSNNATTCEQPSGRAMVL